MEFVSTATLQVPLPARMALSNATRPQQMRSKTLQLGCMTVAMAKR